jgi:hypothetical protein
MAPLETGEWKYPAMTLLAKRPHLTALIVIAVVLGGCSGAQVTSSVPGATTSSAAANSATSSPTSSSTSASATSAAAKALAIEGTPATSVTAGSVYSFQPMVTAKNAAVTFTITGLPAWATFNPTTGALTGTPTAGAVGMTGEITVTASDGNNSASTAPFTIDVQAAVAGSPPPAGAATLSWAAPTQNTDGSPVTGLAGYHIYYGTDESAPSQTVTVAGATATTYVVQGLTPGTYYFTVVAYNASGIDSPDSNVAVKTI